MEGTEEGRWTTGHLLFECKELIEIKRETRIGEIYQGTWRKQRMCMEIIGECDTVMMRREEEE